MILLTGPRRPILSAMAFVTGAALTVFTLGAVLFVSAGAAADVVSDGIGWLRRLAFGLAAVALFVSAARCPPTTATATAAHQSARLVLTSDSTASRYHDDRSGPAERVSLLHRHRAPD
jgi:hypothetical protein